VEIRVSAPQGTISLYNLWDIGNGRARSQLQGAGMIVEEADSGRLRRYRCNDGHSTPTFTHLVFSIEIGES
jgi:hypothetical protein